MKGSVVCSTLHAHFLCDELCPRRSAVWLAQCAYVSSNRSGFVAAAFTVRQSSSVYHVTPATGDGAFFFARRRSSKLGFFMLLNFEDDRTTTLAAKPPLAVLRPCRSTC